MFDDYISDLIDNGPIELSDFCRADGNFPQLIIECYLKDLSGLPEWEKTKFFHYVLERCGCHPEERTSHSRVQAFETARMILIQGPEKPEDLERLLEDLGL